MESPCGDRKKEIKNKSYCKYFVSTLHIERLTCVKVPFAGKAAILLHRKQRRITVWEKSKIKKFHCLTFAAI